MQLVTNVRTLIILLHLINQTCRQKLRIPLASQRQLLHLDLWCSRRMNYKKAMK